MISIVLHFLAKIPSIVSTSPSMGKSGNTDSDLTSDCSDFLEFMISRYRRATAKLCKAGHKGHEAWSSIKVKIFDAWRLFSQQKSSTTSNAPAPGQNTRWPQDAEDSLFCDSLLGLMRQTGRFDYLFGDDEEGK